MLTTGLERRPRFRTMTETWRVRLETDTPLVGVIVVRRWYYSPFSLGGFVMRWRSILTAAAALTLLAVPVSAQTVEDALKVVPKDAMGFVVVNKLSEANAKIIEVAELVDQPLPFDSPLKALKQHLGISKGLNDDGAAILVVFLPHRDRDEPPTLAYVPVADYAALARELKAKNSGGEISEFSHEGKTFVLASRSPFAIVAEAKHRKLLEKALLGGGVGTDLRALHQWLERNQVSGVLTAHGLRAISKKAVEELKKEKDKLAQNPGPGVEFVGAYFDGISDFMEAVGNNVRAAGIGLRMDKKADLRLTARALFTKGSSFSKFAEDLQVPEGGPLAGLPNRQFALALGTALPEKAMANLMKSMGSLMKNLPGLPAGQQKQLEEAYAESGKGLRGMALLVAVPKEGEAIFGNLIGLIRADDAKAYLKRSEKVMTAVEGLLKDANLPVPLPITSKQIKVNGKPAITTSIDLSGVPNIAAAGGILEALFGSADKISTTTVAVDAHTIISAYVAPAAIGKILASGKTKGGLASRPEIAKVNVLLPKGSQLVGYVSPHGTMEMVRRFLAILPIPAPPQFPEMKKSPPAGFAIKLTSSEMQGELIVPAETVRAVVHFVREVRKQNEGQ
jgi:hypothetical protein